MSSVVGPCCSGLALLAHQRHFLAVGLSMQNLLSLSLIVLSIRAVKDTRCRFKEAVAFVGDVVIVLVVSAAVQALEFEVLILI